MTTFAGTASHGFAGSIGRAGAQGRFSGWLARFARRAQRRLEEHALDSVLRQLPRIDPRVQADVRRVAARTRSHSVV